MHEVFEGSWFIFIVPESGNNVEYLTEPMVQGMPAHKVRRRLAASDPEVISRIKTGINVIGVNHFPPVERYHSSLSIPKGGVPSGGKACHLPGFGPGARELDLGHFQVELAGKNKAVFCLEEAASCFLITLFCPCSGLYREVKFRDVPRGRRIEAEIPWPLAIMGMGAAGEGGCFEDSCVFISWEDNSSSLLSLSGDIPDETAAAAGKPVEEFLSLTDNGCLKRDDSELGLSCALVGLIRKNLKKTVSGPVPPYDPDAPVKRVMYDMSRFDFSNVAGSGSLFPPA